MSKVKVINWPLVKIVPYYQNKWIQLYFDHSIIFYIKIYIICVKMDVTHYRVLKGYKISQYMIFNRIRPNTWYFRSKYVFWCNRPRYESDIYFGHMSKVKVIWPMVIFDLDLWHMTKLNIILHIIFVFIGLNYPRKHYLGKCSPLPFRRVREG